MTTLLSTLPTSVQAITLVTQRTALNENDSVEWSSLGSIFPPAVLPSSFILSNKPNIKRLVYSTSESDHAFAINTLSLNTVPVPEPSSLVALGLLGLGAFAVKLRCF